MTFQVELTPLAETQIEAAYRYYRSQNSAFADRWFRSIMSTILAQGLTKLNPIDW